MDWGEVASGVLSETNWIGVGAAILLAATIRKVRAGERILVIRLGNIVGLRGPGPTLAIPFLERMLPFVLAEPCEVVSPKVARVAGTEVPISNPEIVASGQPCFIVEAAESGVVLAHSPLPTE